MLAGPRLHPGPAPAESSEQMDTTELMRTTTGEAGGERVLFIEDSPTLAQLLEISLVQAGYEVVRAGSGEEGLELARAEPPDLLLCDVMLPGIDGFEVVRVLRRELATANMSIIMLTAMANVMEGLDAGADDYVLKPYDHRELLARVRSVLHRATAMRALSPLTGLPGNTRIQEELERAIGQDRRFALLHADLDHFKAYNDQYGFARGDDVLRLTAALLHAAVQAGGGADAFVGQGGGRGPDRALRPRGPDPVRPRGRGPRLHRGREPPAPAGTVPAGVAVGRAGLLGHPALRPLGRGGDGRHRDDVPGQAGAGVDLGRGPAGRLAVLPIEVGDGGWFDMGRTSGPGVELPRRPHRPRRSSWST
jgi:DNA-binding response OmpR family regulator